MPLAGLRVLSLESRRAKEMETLILREGGIPFVAPSVKERAMDADDTAFRFVEQLEAGSFDMVVCMTAVGLTLLRDTVTRRMPVERLSDALRRASIVSRGPKPVGVLKSLGVPIDLIIPEPNTWKEIVEAVAARTERRIAVQEYGRPNSEMNHALEALGASVTPVALYRWELPDDLGPLQEAARRLAKGEVDIVLFTSSIQLDHLLEVARAAGIEADVNRVLREQVAIASIGPVMTSALAAHGFPPEIVPKHPRMWSLVRAAAEQAGEILAAKRGDKVRRERTAQSVLESNR
jgi:uroporphyrinogen-III synthase